ncbi:MAG: hypothetical protein DME03_15965 [Candidatus Rokuibacteriota bacterium]|nr:MAG: hypothetical protein DME03_15965 [Candidatus Rokubacteria bacterium]
MLMQHTAIYGLGPVLGQVAAFLLLPLYTNLLSPADYGVLEIILLVGTFLNVFFGLQTVTQLLRFYHACEGERDRREVVSTAIIFTGAVTAAAILPADLLRDRISLALFGTDAQAPLLHLAFWSMVSSNVFATALGYLQARKMSRAFTLLSVAQLVCILSLNLFFVAWLARGVEGILLSQFLGGPDDRLVARGVRRECGRPDGVVAGRLTVGRRSLLAGQSIRNGAARVHRDAVLVLLGG